MSTRPATRERPIIFTGESVRAILDGRKTVTRRVVEHQGPRAAEMVRRTGTTHTYFRKRVGKPFRLIGPVGVARELGALREVRCPYGEPGDRLWVREAWAPQPGREESVDLPEYDGGRNPDAVCYRADERRAGEDPKWSAGINHAVQRWRSPLFMPRWASRLSLEVVSVRVERLHQITEQDAILEGVLPIGFPRDAFRAGWDVINGRRKGCAWDDNPLVWRIEFRRLAP